MFVFKEKFEEGDYIINRSCGDMAVYDKCDSKGYMYFKYYYVKMFGTLKDCSKWNLQVDYQKFYEKCTDAEKEKMDEIIKGGVYTSEVV